MVGLVIVSHSEKIADGIKEMAIQQTGFCQSIESAGGAVDGTLGTSVTKIRQAIESVDQDEGIVIVADIGSALMSAAMALESFHGKIKIANASVFEGAMAAATALSSKSFEEVLLIAENAKNLI